MEFSTQIILAILFSIIAATSVASLWVRVGDKKKQQRRAPPEAAGALPLLGHLHLLGPNQLLHTTFGDMADKYGPMFLVRLATHPALVVSNWEVAKQVFTTNDINFSSRPRSLAVKLMGYDHKILGFAPYGPYWRKIRKLARLKLLSSHRVELLSHVRDTEVNCFIKELYEQTLKGRGVAVVEMKGRIGDLTTNVIVRTLAGKRYSSGSDDESRRCQDAMAAFFHLAGILLVSDFAPFLGWIDVLTGNISKIKRIGKECDSIVGSWVKEHREKRLGESVKGDHDFIHGMLSIMDDESIPIEEADTTIKATCLSLILGGIDASAITLTWAVSLLLNNRHVLKKAQDELDIHVGKHRQVQESDINNLVYLQAILKETLRLHPPAPLSAPREAMEDCTIAGFHVPAGTRLVLNLWKLHRDPSIWQKPLDFLPDRFVKDHANLDVRGQDYELLPFGSGRRVCPGITYALQFLHLALARLLHGFELGTVSDKSIDMSESPGMAVPKATPLEVTLTPRLPAMLY
ncbi:cytochrome P450, family 82, subfamily C, polypeptide 4 [Hibiscus trionum]|uniref:Cytochrome P450, family 82, subfamily C, polypeptide 4 n=1 Tax=Hibiscus trionum TaxID=183268 RepID=A0A9W7J7V0_HIBTR|nr:cytochrome P450, family 82, subfamily C, polypeptide 4 [Hibiscus trionum]